MVGVIKMKIITLESDDVRRLVERGFINADVEDDGKKTKEGDDIVRIEHVSYPDILNNIEIQLEILFDEIADIKTFQAKLIKPKKKKSSKK